MGYIAQQDGYSSVLRFRLDWSHTAMKYWPERVREKCKTYRSYAIAYGLEHLYVE